MQLEESRNLDLSYNKENENHHQFSLRNILIILFRHKLMIIVIFVVTVAVVAVFELSKPDAYISEAKLLVKPGREKISWDASMLGVGSPNISSNSAVDLGSELIILTSGPVIVKVVDAIGPEELTVNTVEVITPQERQQMAIDCVLENLIVGVQKGARHINLRFQAENPRIAKKVLDNVIEFYMERRIEVFQNKLAPKFLAEQSEIALSKLEQIEEEFKQFRSKRGIISMEGQKSALLEQISLMVKSMDDINLQMSYKQSNIILLEKKLQEPPDVTEILNNFRSDPVVVSIKQRLVDLKFSESELENRYPDDSRVLIDLRKRISFAEAELLKAQEENTELGTGGTGIDAYSRAITLELENLQAQLEALLAQKELLKKALKVRNADLVKLANNESMFLRLQRKADTARIEYDQYRDNYTIAKSSAALDADKISNVVVVQPASLPIKPIESKRRKGIALGLVLGLFGSVGIAYVRELLDDSIKSNEEVMKRLELPILASINCK
jgi:uncharacterized protein involved in exopolysaccharide biosynthesis